MMIEILNDGRDGLTIEPLELFEDGHKLTREVLSTIPGDSWNPYEPFIRISDEGL